MAEVTITPHPCKDINDVMSIRKDGVLVGYCGAKPGMPISFIRDEALLGSDFIEAAKAKVAAEIGEPNKVTATVPAVPDEDDSE